LLSICGFLTLMWREVGADVNGAATDWQSEVEHIQSGRCWMFNTLDACKT
jgi:hypothetical protein